MKYQRRCPQDHSKRTQELEPAPEQEQAGVAWALCWPFWPGFAQAPNAQGENKPYVE